MTRGAGAEWPPPAADGEHDPMTHTSRRAVLTALAAAAVTGPLLDTATAPRAHAAGESDVYASNTDLYTRLAGREGIDFARRYRRHEVLDHSEAGRQPYNRTTVLAMHGGAIEGARPSCASA